MTTLLSKDSIQDPYPWDKAIKRGIISFLFSRLLTILGAGIVVVGNTVRDNWAGIVPVRGLTGLVRVFDNWDGHWYLQVVRYGYPHIIRPNVTYAHPDARAAFFPLFPKLVHYVDLIVPGGPVATALLVNIIVSFFFIYLIGCIARELFDNKTAEKSMIIAAFFPGSFVLTMAYSEALILTIAALCFVALRRHSWVWAGILAMLTTMGRPNGIAIIAACAVASFRAIRDERDWRSLFAPLLAPWGFIGFMIFLRYRTHEPWAWFRVQRQAWKEGTSFGATAVERTFRFLLHPLSSPTTVLTGVTVIAMVIALWFLYKYRLPAMYNAYIAVVLALMLIPATVTARPRFLFTAFPLIFPVARALRDDDDSWWPLTLVVFGAGLVTITAVYGVRGAIP